MSTVSENIAFDPNEDYGDEMVVCAKWTMDGAKTLAEAAELLRAHATWLERTAAEGWDLVAPVAHDFGLCRKETHDFAS